MRRGMLFALVGSALAGPAAVAQTPQPPDHPWAIRPEVGGWVIMVKAYQGPNAKDVAERFAKELRATYKVPAFLFEKGADERKKEEARVAVAREKQRQAEQAQFLQLTERMRADALAKGYEFQETPLKLRVPKVRYEEQYAVLIGGWPTMDAARKQLDVIRQWPLPADTGLLDSTTIVSKRGGERAFLNPFHTAFVSRNPVAAKVLDEESQTDPRMIQLNSAEELSVLRIRKGWTIVVKMYSLPIKDIKDKDGSKGGNALARVFNPEADPHTAICRQAREMAVMLRNIKTRPVEGYVLYTFNGAMVCVGQFDGPEDPALKAEQTHLETLTFEVSKAKGGPGEKQRMFDQLVAMRVR